MIIKMMSAIVRQITMNINFCEQNTQYCSVIRSRERRVGYSQACASKEENREIELPSVSKIQDERKKDQATIANRKTAKGVDFTVRHDHRGWNKLVPLTRHVGVFADSPLRLSVRRRGTGGAGESAIAGSTKPTKRSARRSRVLAKRAQLRLIGYCVTTSK